MNRTVLILTLGILLVGFLSTLDSSLTGQVTRDQPTCELYRAAIHDYLHEEQNLAYDVTYDGIFDATDLRTLYTLVDRTQCPREHQCATIGTLYSLHGNTLVCVRAEDGTHVLQLVDTTSS